MQSKGFSVRVDGREVWVDQVTQRVTVLDEQGKAVFRDRIQVAAGSVQGLFTAAMDVGTLGIGTEPASKA